MNNAEKVFNAMTIDISMVECGAGWEELYLPVIAEAQRQGVKVLQVKEKFGTLRIYLGASPDHDELWKAVTDAEMKSTHRCETCGAQGKARNIGMWMKTFCDVHAYEVERKRDQAQRVE